MNTALSWSSDSALRVAATSASTSARELYSPNDARTVPDVTPHLVRRAGVAARVQGMRRYYALVIEADGKARLVRELDGTTVLAEQAFPLELYRTYQMELAVNGASVTGRIDGDVVLSATDDALPSGGIALLVDEGRTGTQTVSVTAP